MCDHNRTTAYVKSLPPLITFANFTRIFDTVETLLANAMRIVIGEIPTDRIDRFPRSYVKLLADVDAMTFDAAEMKMIRLMISSVTNTPGQPPARVLIDDDVRRVFAEFSRHQPFGAIDKYDGKGTVAANKEKKNDDTKAKSEVIPTATPPPPFKMPLYGVMMDQMYADKSSKIKSNPRTLLHSGYHLLNKISSCEPCVNRIDLLRIIIRDEAISNLFVVDAPSSSSSSSTPSSAPTSDSDTMTVNIDSFLRWVIWRYYEEYKCTLHAEFMAAIKAAKCAKNSAKGKKERRGESR